MSRQILNFTIGPVQGFIEDARRTRDLWAGSFLLSWLSGHAMAALKEKGGMISFPEISGEPLFEAILATRAGMPITQTPFIGSLPNRFRAEVPVGINGAEVCSQAMKEAWNKLASAVWDQFVSKIANTQTQEIWDRQVNHFWDIAWTSVPAGQGDHNELDRRKNYRVFGDSSKPPEGGDLCRLMGQFQEISGFHRIGAKKNQRQFWESFSSNIKTLDLAADERLCSIALIKRLFPRLDDLEEVIGWRPGGTSFNVVNWPSVSYLSAVPWLIAVKERGHVQSCDDYSVYIQDVLKSGHFGETETRLFPELVGSGEKGFNALDGHLLHPNSLETYPIEHFKSQERSAIDRNSLIQKLNAIGRELGNDPNIDPQSVSPSNFYAVLLMDGDEIGKALGEDLINGTVIVKTGLAKFTHEVQQYYDPTQALKNPASGVLIYAGGDDVLALHPLDSAIRAAKDLNAIYAKSFDDVSENIRPSLSGAIIYAHHKIPLRAVLQKAREYLKDSAKEKNGRNSLALAVLKPGGVTFDWVSRWDAIGGGLGPVHALELTAQDRVQFSSSYLYNIRSRYKSLFDNQTDQSEPVFGQAGFMKSVLIAEYKKQPGRGQMTYEEVEDITKPILAIGQPLHNTKVGQGYSFDGPLIARFLSTEGLWHLSDGADDGA